MIIAIYGVSGAGKTTVGRTLSKNIDDSVYLSEYEIIKSYCSGNFSTFLNLSENNRQKIREISIGEKLNKIQDSKQTVIMDCHFSFPLKNLGATKKIDKPFHIVMPKECIKRYGFIVYLDTSPRCIIERISESQITYKNKVESEIIDWQNFEKAQLKRTCYLNSVPYCEVKNDNIENCVSIIRKIIKR